MESKKENAQESNPNKLMNEIDCICDNNSTNDEYKLKEISDLIFGHKALSKEIAGNTMSIKDRYSNTTEQGCNKTIGELQGLHPNITVGEILSFMESREKKAKEEDEAQAKKIIEELVGKCLRIEFNQHDDGVEHIVLLKIDDIEIENKYGSVTANMIGEKITMYNGDLRYGEMKQGDNGNNYDNYSPNKSEMEIGTDVFIATKDALLSIKL